MSHNRFDNAEALAKHYVEVLESTPNAWGEHVCPYTGKASHGILNDGYRVFGETAFNAAVAAEFEGRMSCKLS